MQTKVRTIIVDDASYRWSPSQDSGYMVLVVQHHSGKGKERGGVISGNESIVVENGSYSIEVGAINTLVITPALVERLIRDSLVLGWNPRAAGPPLALSLNAGRLEIRKGL